MNPFLSLGLRVVCLTPWGLVVDVVPTQTAWQVAFTPANGWGTHCYDAERARMVFTSFRGDTYERGATGGWNWVAVGSPTPRSSWFSGIAYDRTRRRVVLYDGVNTWHWDGGAWMQVGPLPTPLWGFTHIIAHEQRGTVMAFGGSNPWTANDLYEWDGANWNLVPATIKPPRPGNSNASQVYLTSAYDARRDRLVLFGTGWNDWNTFQLTNPQPTLWEWDATNGWVNPVVQGSLMLPCTVFFDAQRGVITKLQGRPMETHEWDGGNAWQPVVPVVTPSASLGVSPYGAYDPTRGSFHVGLVDLQGNAAYTYGTVNQARFESLAPGCPGTLGEPTLRLAHNWTRAWMGRSLSVDLTNLPQSTGFVAIGWSNQQAGAFPLPLDLAPYGMPGCFARVATDLIVPVTGANTTATLTMAVPQNNALLGVVLYQQGFALDPVANAAGLTAGNAVRVTIGRL